MKDFVDSGTLSRGYDHIYKYRPCQADKQKGQFGENVEPQIMMLKNKQGAKRSFKKLPGSETPSSRNISFTVGLSLILNQSLLKIFTSSVY